MFLVETSLENEINNPVQSPRIKVGASLPRLPEFSKQLVRMSSIQGLDGARVSLSCLTILYSIVPTRFSCLHNYHKGAKEMSCQHWNAENSFCECREKTINPDELADCTEECEDYLPQQAYLQCRECGNRFKVGKDEEVAIKDLKQAKCPNCGSVNLRRDDDILTK